MFLGWLSSSKKRQRGKQGINEGKKGVELQGFRHKKVQAKEAGIERENRDHRSGASGWDARGRVTREEARMLFPRWGPKPLCERGYTN